MYLENKIIFLDGLDLNRRSKKARLFGSLVDFQGIFKTQSFEPPPTLLGGGGFETMSERNFNLATADGLRPLGNRKEEYLIDSGCRWNG